VIYITLWGISHCLGVARTLSDTHTLGVNKDKSIPLDSFPWEAKKPFRACDHPACNAPGDHRAPKCREDIESYFWFCLDHVRDYNKSWNYFADMSLAEIEAYNRSDMLGWRPTWPMGEKGNASSAGGAYRMEDPYDVGEEDEGESDQERRRGGGGKEYEPQRKALALIGLEAPLTIERLKARYKALVKRHHPDANGGTKESEEHFKDVNEAYMVLKSFLCTD
jgi:hypothetical protein